VKEGSASTSWDTISHHPLWSALIATVAGGLILTAILNIPSGSSKHGGGSGSADPGTGPQGSSTPAQSHSSIISGTQLSHSPPASVVLWRRTIHLPYEYGIDIDSASPKVASIPDPAIDFYTAIYTSDNEPGFSFGANSAGTTGARNPTYQQCKGALVDNVVDSSYTTKVGQTICLESGASEPNLAAIHVLKWNPDTEEMVVHVIVWSDQGSS
jgi:hypothetical protein